MQTALPRDPGSESVSLVKLKDVVRRLLPPGSTARSVILAEKDSVTSSEAAAKFEVFDRLLCMELRP
ncbi:MAG: hypothetical protein JRN54_06250 [Nitrososphaerota archaeon]|nr:hypothetical protein [Nitrososphaerota archaeon]